MVGLAQCGIIGSITVVILFALRALLFVVISLWSLKADKAGRTHALALLRILKSFPTRDRSP